MIKVIIAGSIQSSILKTQNGLNTVIFDLDGTIIDSEKTAFEVAKSVLPRFGKKVSEEDLAYLRGRAWFPIIKEWFPDNGQEVYNQILTEWDSLYPGSSMYDGVLDSIIELHNLGIRLAIVSSKENEYIFKDLQELSLGKYFEIIVGQKDTYRHKPHPDPLILAARMLDEEPSNCIYIGDQPSDIMASRSAGMKSGGALWGEGDRELLAPSDPDYMFQAPGDVIASLFPELSGK